MTDTIRLLQDLPAPGAWNMAVDEVLLDRAVRERTACWRFYAWSEPTLSLGYFQDYKDRWAHDASGRCPVVRRLTGGGAILHDAELTYSVVLPSDHPLAAHRDRLYQTVHGCLIEALARLGVRAETCGGTARAGREPLLCFQRRSPGDVLLGGVKIAGSAQRRREGAVLQHGSLLLARSPAAPELPGLQELADGQSIPAEKVVERWLARLADGLPARWVEDSLTDEERRLAAERLESRYRQSFWTEHRGRTPQACLFTPSAGRCQDSL